MFLCGKCKAQNDDQRKVCYECGNSLDKETSLFIPGKPTMETEAGLSAPPISSPQGPKKFKKLKQAVRIPWRAISALLILGASGVAVYFAMQDPSLDKREFAPVNAKAKDFRSLPATPNPESVKRLLAAMKAASGSRGGVWSVREFDINELLVTEVKLQPISNALGVDIRYRSCSARLGNGALDALMSLEVANYPVYLFLVMKPVIKDGNMSVQYASAAIGRLYIPEVLAGWIARFFEPIAHCLHTPLEQIAKAKAVEITPEKVVVRWP